MKRSGFVSVICACVSKEITKHNKKVTNTVKQQIIMPKAPLIYQPNSCFNTPKLVQFDKLNLVSKIFNHGTREIYILWDNLIFFKTQFLPLPCTFVCC
jgi:hypothetical protein